MRYGRSVPKGFLPVYSVDTEEEAQDLLVAACATNIDGDFIARELVSEQSIPNLHAFGDRLAATHERIQKIRSSRSTNRR